MSLFKLIAGATAGLAAGLLFANKTGKEFRGDLKGKTAEEKAEIFGKEILEMGKDLGKELKKLPENEQVKKLKTLGDEKLEVLIEEIKKSGSKKFSEAKEFGQDKLDGLIPKLEETLNELKKTGVEKAGEVKKTAEKEISKKISSAKKIFKKEENMGAKMTKIFKK